MKKKLEQLSIQEFVEMLCGNIEVLKDSRHEIVTEDKIKETVRCILLEYREIISPGGQRNYIMETANLVKERGRAILYSVCQTLVEIGECERVKVILEESGVRCQSFNEDRLKAEVSSRLARAKDNLSKMGKEEDKAKSDPDNIRKDFDMQTASLMAHFKFQIDPITMRASIYANLVSRLDREVKEMSNAVKKVRRK